MALERFFWNVYCPKRIRIIASNIEFQQARGEAKGTEKTIRQIAELLVCIHIKDVIDQK